MDIDDGYILWTGIWKGSPNTISLTIELPLIGFFILHSAGKFKRFEVVMENIAGPSDSNLADIAKMIESQPNLAPLIRRVRGGYLKIQGTWMPYEVGRHRLVTMMSDTRSPST